MRRNESEDLPWEITGDKPGRRLDPTELKLFFLWEFIAAEGQVENAEMYLRERLPYKTILEI